MSAMRTIETSASQTQDADPTSLRARGILKRKRFSFDLSIGIVIFLHAPVLLVLAFLAIEITKHDPVFQEETDLLLDHLLTQLSASSTIADILQGISSFPRGGQSRPHNDDWWRHGPAVVTAGLLLWIIALWIGLIAAVQKQEKLAAEANQASEADFRLQLQDKKRMMAKVTMHRCWNAWCREAWKERERKFKAVSCKEVDAVAAQEQSMAAELENVTSERNELQGLQASMDDRNGQLQRQLVRRVSELESMNSISALQSSLELAEVEQVTARQEMGAQQQELQEALARVNTLEEVCEEESSSSKQLWKDTESQREERLKLNKESEDQKAELQHVKGLLASAITRLDDEKAQFAAEFLRNELEQKMEWSEALADAGAVCAEMGARLKRRQAETQG